MSGVVADGAVWSGLVVVPTPFLDPSIFAWRRKSEVPLAVQALGPELAVEGLDDGFVRRCCLRNLDTQPEIRPTLSL